MHKSDEFFVSSLSAQFERREICISTGEVLFGFRKKGLMLSTLNTPFRSAGLFVVRKKLHRDLNHVIAHAEFSDVSKSALTTMHIGTISRENDRRRDAT